MIQPQLAVLLSLEAQDAPAGFVQIVERMGVPVGVLLILVFALWRVAKWTAPKLDDVFKSHVDFVKTSRQMMVEHGKTLGRIEICVGNCTEGQKETQKENAALLSGMRESMDDLLVELRANGGRG